MLCPAFSDADINISVTGIAGPVVALLDSHLPNSRQKFLIGRNGWIHLGPLLPNADEPRAGYFMPLAKLAVVYGRFVERDVDRLHLLRADAPSFLVPLADKARD